MKASIPSYRTTEAVFSRPEVVAYMLREVKRTGGFGKWSGLRILEPNCEDGAFVLPIVDALVAERPNWRDESMYGFLSAFDILEASLLHVRRGVMEKLAAAGCPNNITERLTARWFVCDDILLHGFNTTFNVVIGNPPYIKFDRWYGGENTAP